MPAILKREMLAYVCSPIGWVYIAVFWFFSGYFLFTGTLSNNTASLAPVFSNMVNVVLVLTPLLTMRLLSDERRNKTDQALLCAPVTLGGIVSGKFFAAVIVYVLAISAPLFQAIVLSCFARLPWGEILGSFIALLCLGLAIIALGEFISGLTENLGVAAVSTFAVVLLLFLIDALPSIIPLQIVFNICGAISFVRRYSPMTAGLLPLNDIVYFLSVAFGFLFLTERVMERRRWAG
jgi:ABC-2 type transport system permease protein